MAQLRTTVYTIIWILYAVEVVWLLLETSLTWWPVYSLALVMVCGAVHLNFIVIVIGGGGRGSGG